MTAFIPGLRLSKLFYREAVKPILRARWPGLRYSAALMGCGSEVLGYDTPMSTDHHWGPRLLLFLSEADHRKLASAVKSVMAESLPRTFRGYSTNYTASDECGVQLLTPVESGPVNHRVETHTIRQFVKDCLGVDFHPRFAAVDWLVLPEQHLLEMTGGEVYHDGLKQLNQIRRKFSYFPKDVWLCKLAAQWRRIGQEEPFMGRCGDNGDELGSQIIAARLGRDIMKLCFLMERQYTPYSKWLGTAFSRLKCAKKLSQPLHRAVAAPCWQERETSFVDVYRIVTRMHNALAITKPISTKASPFHGRPFLVIHADRIADEITKRIRSRDLRGVAGVIGSVDQFTDCTDVIENHDLCRKLKDVLLPHH